MKEKLEHTDNFELPESLKDLQGQNPFSVPEGFFEGQQAVLNAIATPQAAVVSAASSWFSLTKLAIAAAVTAVVAVTAVLTTRNSDEQSNPVVDADDSTKIELLIPIEQNSEKKNTITIHTPQGEKELIGQPKPKIDQSKDRNQKVFTEEKESYAADNSQKKSTILPSDKNGVPNMHQVEASTTNSVEQSFQNQSHSGNGVFASHTSNSQLGNTSQSLAKPENESINLGLTLGEDVQSLDPVQVIARTRVAKKPFYLWSTGDTTSSIFVYSSGVYSVKVSQDKDMSVCDYDTIVVTIVPRPRLILDKDIQMCSNDPLTLSALSSNEHYEYSWNNGEYTTESISLTKLEPGFHEFSLSITACGERFEDVVLVEVKNCAISVPNIITPNGDRVNDYFVVDGIENYPGTKLMIHNRNGKVVYQSNNYQNDWNAEGLEDDTYFYVLILADGYEKENVGMVRVMRK